MWRFKADNKKFFERFQKKHDISVQYVDETIKLCNELNDAVTVFGRELTAAQTECKIAKFLDLLFENRFKILHTKLALMEQVYHLTFMAEDNSCPLNCIGRKDRSNSCEAQIDDLSCNLIKFRNGIRPVGDKVIQTILEFIDICNKIYDIGRGFSCSHRPSCKNGNCDDGKDCKNLISEAKRISQIFNEVIAIGRGKLADIKKICDSLKAVITKWIEKLGK